MSSNQSTSENHHDSYRSSRRSPPYRRDRDRDRRDHDGGRRSYKRDDRHRSGRRDEYRQRDDFRRRSRSPVYKRRRKEDLEDLSDVIPINERKRQDPRWDIKPKSYEDVSIEVAKLSGIFPSPGNPKPPLARLRAVLNNDMDKISETLGSNNLLTAANYVSLSPETARGARIILIHLPITASSDDETTMKDVKAKLAEYYGSLNAKHEIPRPVVKEITKTANPQVIAVEFSNNELATLSLALDPSHIFNTTGTFRFERPASYIVPNTPEDSSKDAAADSTKQQISSKVLDSASKIAVSKIPEYLEEEQVIELLSAFGELKSFTLLRDNDDASKGIALADFKDPNISTLVCQGLNGTQVGENNLVVKLTCVGLHQDPQVTSNSIEKLLKLKNQSLGETSVLQLFNLITWDNLTHEGLVEDVVKEVKAECMRVTNSDGIQVDIPEEQPKTECFGPRVFVRFKNASDCKTALTRLAGRKFWERTIIAALYVEENFDLRVYI